jgi:polysaccharide deacetylase 2 family uncharacterized protein YibQ
MGKRLARRQRHPRWHFALSGLLLAGAIALSLYIPWRENAKKGENGQQTAYPVSTAPPFHAADAGQLADSLYAGIDSALVEMGLWPELFRKQRREDIDYIEIGVPADLPLVEANLVISRFAQDLGGQVLGASQRREQVEIHCGFKGTATTTLILTPIDQRRRTGNIAIVLDDFGGGGRGIAERFCALLQPLTLAVLPNEGDVTDISARARNNGHEILVHLPMEPEGKQDPGAGAVGTNHDNGEIRRRVRQALEKMPHARGISNHMGSKATANERVMHQVLTELKARNLLFLDSRTTARSLGYQMAIDMDLVAFNRDLFIDEINEAEAIESRLWDLAGIAARTGQAVGIGHDREATLSALTNVLPRLETRGFRFVPISRLLP